MSNNINSFNKEDNLITREWLYSIFEKFANLFTGSLNKPLLIIIFRFVAANIALFFILAVPILIFSPTFYPGLELEYITFPFITPIYITPGLSILTGIRLIKNSANKLRKVLSYIIFIFPAGLFYILLLYIILLDSSV